MTILELLDLNPEYGAEIVVGKEIIWVNVDGLCRLRLNRCPLIRVVCEGEVYKPAPIGLVNVDEGDKE
ncbi:hypothetical protein LCGC14_2446820 [marine sediment metagenome]|uniref:Uncharacterized protein n=1 Tax=marine sediment metagenome TaxID=412755 RepID=A0A0F9C4V2_9ZZZZ